MQYFKTAMVGRVAEWVGSMFLVANQSFELPPLGVTTKAWVLL
jgi:hypothetical protein